MNRRRKNFQSYRAPRGHGKSFKFIIIASVLIAVVSALILGAVLGNRAEYDKYGKYERQNLIDFGGVEKPEKDYESFPVVVGKYVVMDGLGKSSFRSAIRGYMQSSAIVYDINGVDGVYFKTDIAGINSLCDMTVEEIGDVLSGEDRYGIACFSVGSLNDSTLKDKLSMELAVISEAASFGVNEIMLFGLPSDTESSKYVGAYLSFVEADLKKTAITVVLSRNDIDTAGASRLISSSLAYVDGYAIDMRTANNNELPRLIEKCAYYITNYNARVIVNDAEGEEREEIEAILSSYGIENYVFKK